MMFMAEDSFQGSSFLYLAKNPSNLTFAFTKYLSNFIQSHEKYGIFKV